MQTKYDELARLASDLRLGPLGVPERVFIDAALAQVPAMHTALVKALADRDALAEAAQAVMSGHPTEQVMLTGGWSESEAASSLAALARLRAALARVKEGA